MKLVVSYLQYLLTMHSCSYKRNLMRQNLSDTVFRYEYRLLRCNFRPIKVRCEFCKFLYKTSRISEVIVADSSDDLIYRGGLHKVISASPVGFHISVFMLVSIIVDSVCRMSRTLIYL